MAHIHKRVCETADPTYALPPCTVFYNKYDEWA